MAELTTADKLSLIAQWRKSEHQDVAVYGALFLVGLTFTLLSSRFTQLTGFKQAELVTLLLGGSTLPKACAEIWKHFKAAQRLAFLSQAYTQNIALAHADALFQKRLNQFTEGS